MDDRLAPTVQTLPQPLRSRITQARVILPGAPLGATLKFFVDELGFVVETIFPADDPTTAIVVGYGLRIEFDPQLAPPANADATCLRLQCSGETPATRVAPNGTRVEFVGAEPALELPPLVADRVVTRNVQGENWVAGRAGMLYRDLIPGRLGGRFIASHIRIEDGGPVPDYVHFHRVRFQMIYCYKGWVRLVYEDQGEAFVLRAGDCVLQPPTIRHRVLESSAGLEVIEIGCPAVHETHADLDLELPNGRASPGGLFGGHTFVRYTAQAGGGSGDEHNTTGEDSLRPGFRARAMGLKPATGQLAEARSLNLRSGESPRVSHDAEFDFLFVLRGEIECVFDGEVPQRFGPGDALVIPAGDVHRWRNGSDDLELLSVTLPASPTFRVLSQP